MEWKQKSKKDDADDEGGGSSRKGKSTGQSTEMSSGSGPKSHK